jgi:hypothetical protein
MSQDFCIGSTYTTLGGSALLLDVQIAELTTGCLDDANLLALGVVWRTSPLPRSQQFVQVHVVPSSLHLFTTVPELQCDIRR